MKRLGAALAGGRSAAANLRPLLDVALDGLTEGARRRSGPLPAGDPADLESTVRAVLGEVIPTIGTGSEEALGTLTELLAYGAADPADPRCTAHLHTPPLAVAVAADLAASALNPSLDSWDQAPAASIIETEVVRALAALVGFRPDAAAGVITSGGTESNLMGLLLARDTAVRRVYGVDAASEGLPPEARLLRFFCSELAHFSVRRVLGMLGLGEQAAVPVAADGGGRMAVPALRRALDETDGVPAAVVATAGTTDFGSIDPVAGVASVAADAGIWLHVDAAYGGGALFSDLLSPVLAGLPAADSVSLDLHKLGWQPIAAGVFLARDAGMMAPLATRAAYLNPADDEDAGYFSLLGRSLRTTRRADVFKIAVTLRALGRSGLGALVESCHDLAQYAAGQVDAHPDLELATEPALTTVVFRYAAADDAEDRPDGLTTADLVNAALRRRLLRSGQAVVGRTEIGAGGPAEPGVWLKLTMLNPYTTRADIDGVLELVAAAGRAESA